MTRDTSHFDVLIVGGGVIGLSLAWELAQQDAKVCVVDRGPLGHEASWAGAGMIPPGPARSHWHLATPFEQLEGLSQRLQSEWHERLLEQTGIDSDYHQSGAIYLANTEADADQLDKKAERWQQLGIEHNELAPAALSDFEPTLATSATQFKRAYYLPEEAQTRNPRHLRALVAACESTGVELRPNVSVQNFEADESRLISAVTVVGSIRADKFCIAAGSWSGKFAEKLGLDLPVCPIRGQILLLNGPPGLLHRTINVGPRYLVPRRDGHLLVGSTQEEVGFVKENTTEGEKELLQFANSISPEIAQLPRETRWSGLRPGTCDDLPYLGLLPQHDNGWIATGHYRSGLQLSPATAVVMREMMLGEEPAVDVTALGVNRLEFIS